MNADKLVVYSHARSWRVLNGEVQRLFAAARHRHPRAEHWWLRLILDPRLLPVGQAEAPPGLMALHAALNDQGLAHAVDAHFDDSNGGPPGHRLDFHYVAYKNRKILSKPSGSRLTPNVFLDTQPESANANPPFDDQPDPGDCHARLHHPPRKVCPQPDPGEPRHVP